MNRKEAYEQTKKRWILRCEGKDEEEACGFCEWVKEQAGIDYSTTLDCTKYCPLVPAGVCGDVGGKGLFSEWNEDRTTAKALKVLVEVIRVGSLWVEEEHGTLKVEIPKDRPEPKFKVGETVIRIQTGEDFIVATMEFLEGVKAWLYTSTGGTRLCEEYLKPAPKWVDVTGECIPKIEGYRGFNYVTILHGGIDRIVLGKKAIPWNVLDGKNGGYKNYKVEFSGIDDGNGAYNGFRILHLQEEKK